MSSSVPSHSNSSRWQGDSSQPLLLLSLQSILSSLPRDGLQYSEWLRSLRIVSFLRLFSLTVISSSTALYLSGHHLNWMGETFFQASKSNIFCSRQRPLQLECPVWDQFSSLMISSFRCFMSCGSKLVALFKLLYSSHSDHLKFVQSWFNSIVKNESVCVEVREKGYGNEGNW